MDGRDASAEEGPGMTHPDPAPTELEADCAAPEGYDDDSTVFGTFFIGDTQLAFPAAQIQEVVPHPSITAIPLCPDYVSGMFNLRGCLVPVVDIAGVLQTESRVAQQERVVAVIDCGESLIGAVFDRTGEVRAVAPEHCWTEAKHTHKNNQVIDGVIRLHGDEEVLVQQLSPALLGAVEAVPRLNDGSGSLAQEVPAEEERSAIVVRLGGCEFALDVTSVLEIQAPLPVTSSPRYFEFCSGVVQLRGDVIPVLDLHELLQQPQRERTSEDRLVFVVHDNVRWGIFFDELVDTVTFVDSNLIRFPRLARSGLAELCTNVISREGRDILKLEVPSMAERCGIGSAAAFMEGARFDTEGAEVEEEQDLGFLVFRVGELNAGLPLDCVGEIQPLGQDGMVGDGLNASGAGLFNLRGCIVPLVDPRVHCGDASADTDEKVVIFLRTDQDPIALVADQVESIVRATASEITDVSGLLASTERKGMLKFAGSAIKIEQNGAENAMIVLDLDRLRDAVY